MDAEKKGGSGTMDAEITGGGSRTLFVECVRTMEAGLVGKCLAIQIEQQREHQRALKAMEDEVMMLKATMESHEEDLERAALAFRKFQLDDMRSFALRWVCRGRVKRLQFQAFQILRARTSHRVLVRRWFLRWRRAPDVTSEPERLGRRRRSFDDVHDMKAARSSREKPFLEGIFEKRRDQTVWKEKEKKLRLRSLILLRRRTEKTRAFAMWRRRKGTALRRAMNLLSKRYLTPIFLKWRDQRKTSAGHNKLAVLVVARAREARGIAWRRWRDFVTRSDLRRAHQKSRNQVLVAVGRRRTVICVSNAFHTWRHKITETRLRSVRHSAATRCLDHLVNNRLAKAFQKWRLVVTRDFDVLWRVALGEMESELLEEEVNHPDPWRVALGEIESELNKFEEDEQHDDDDNSDDDDDGPPFQQEPPKTKMIIGARRLD